ncbi:MAG: hypothetical protein Q7S50_01490 [bacterium]|nr:hypothetical protein [bacterium]
MAIRQRNDPVRLFGKRLLLVALFVGVIVAIGGAWSAYKKERESRALRVEAEAQLRDFSERQAQLDSDIANLQTDRGMEGVLREQYALAARGEKLIVIVEPQKPEPIEAPPSVLQWLHRVFPWW